MLAASAPRRRRRPGRVYFYLDARVVFLTPAEAALFTPAELVEYRKTWAKR